MINTSTKVIVGLLAVLAFTAVTQADIPFNVVDGNLSATATFGMSGSNLIVTLDNDSGADVMNPSQVLTGVFFSIDGFGGALTPVSAVLTSMGASAVLYDTQQGGSDPGYEAGGVVGGEFAYTNDVVGAPGGANNIITAAGLGLVGPEDRFNGNNLAGPEGVDGLQYGILSDGYAAGGNPAVTGQFALVNTDVQFTLSGLPGGFSLDDIGDVSFQYGTDFSGGVIPAPGALLLGAMGLGMVGWMKRRVR